MTRRGNSPSPTSPYAQAVEAANARDAIARGLELLDQGARTEAARATASNRIFTKRLPAVVAGARRILDVIEVGGPRGTAGIGLDATEAETVRAELGRIVSAHRRTLDELPIAVAIFSADQQLVFYNAAYRALFRFDAAFLDERPTDSSSSTGCAPNAGCRNRRISAAGRRNCSRRTGRSNRRSTGGTCRAGAFSASSPIRTPKAA